MADDEQRRYTRDQILADVSRALRECYPDRSDEILREVERRMPMPDRTHAKELLFSVTITDISPDSLTHAMSTGLNELESKRVTGIDYSTDVMIQPVESESGGRLFRIVVVSTPR